MNAVTLSECRALVPVAPAALVPAGPQAVVQLEPLTGKPQFVFALLLPGETLADYFERAGIDLAGRPARVAIGGRRVPAELWHLTRPRHGELIEVQAVLQGGGSGRKVARTVLQLGVIALAIWNPMAFGKLALATFVFGASMAINALLPPLPPRLRQFRSDNPSPTYSLSGAQNRTRPYEPLPVVMGRHRFVPDLGAAQYTEFEGEDQYLYAIFNWGLDTFGYNITDLKLGDTPLSSFTDVALEWSGYDGKVTIAAGNVDTLAGGSLAFAAGFLTRTSSVNAVALAIDIEGLLFWTGNEGIQPLSANIEAEYRLVGSGTWLPFFVSGYTFATSYWSVGYTAGGAWQQYDFDRNLAAGAHIEGDVYGTLPQGGDAGGTITLTWSYKTVAEAQANGWALPNLAVPTGNAMTEVISSSTTKPLRKTYRRDVAAGQYEVRVRRANVEETDSRATSQLQWSVLRTYQRDTADYTGQRRLAVKIKASGQLQGAMDTLNAVAERATWAWTGSAWQLAQTSNPAWWLLFVAKGLFLSGRRIFGIGMLDGQIDYDAIKAWGAWCTTKGLEFNGVLDQTLSNGQLLDAICAAGWAAKTFDGGKLGVVWDADALPVSGVVNMHNIVAGTFKVQYATDPLADEIVCSFLNADNGWAQEEVRVPAAAASPKRSQTIELWGVTSRAQAGRAANLRYAEQLYRRKVLEWEMDAEGTIARKGDVLALTHDMTQWGYGGRVLSLSGATAGSTLVLDRRVPANLTAANDEWIGIRVPGESGYRVLRVQCVPAGANNDNDTLTLVDAWPGGVDLPGATRPAMDYLWVYDFKATPGYRVKVVEKKPLQRPDGTMGAVLRAVPDVPQFYAAEGGTFGVVAVQSLLNSTPVVSGLVISAEAKRDGDILVAELTATWSANDQYASAVVTGVVTTGSALKPVEIGTVSAGQRRISWRASLTERSWTVTVRPFNGGGQPGAAISASYTVTVLDAPPPAPTTLTLGSSTARRRLLVAMTQVPPDLAGFVIRYQSGATITWASASAFGQFAYAAGSTSPFACEATVPEAAGTYSFEVRTISKAGVVSTSGAQLLNQALINLPAVVGYLTSEACTLAANSAGDVADFGPATTTMKVLIDGADDSANWSYSRVNGTGVTSAINSSSGVCNVSAMSVDSSYVDITAARAGFASITKRFSLAKARAGVGGSGDPGPPGSPGQRGSQWFYISGQTAWSDSVADSHITSLGLTKVARDTVTQYGTNFAQTRYWSGAAWVQVAVAVDGNLLVNGTVAANSLAIGAYSGNLIPNSGPVRDQSPLTGWVMTWNAQGRGDTSGTPYNSAPDWAPRGLGGVGFYWGAASSPVDQILGDIRPRPAGTANDSWLPVVAGKRYELSAYCEPHRCKAQASVVWFDATGTYLSENVGTTVTAGGQYQAPLASWRRSVCFATAPAGAAYAIPGVRTYGNGETIPYLFFAAMYFGEALPYQSDPMPWSPAGGMTLIDGGDIVAGTVTAAKMVANLFQSDNVLTRNLTVRDASGNVILAAGTNLDWSRLSNQPGGIYNTNITIGANGAIVGAGGGQVTLGGLGAGSVAWLNTVPDAYISSVGVGKLLAGALGVGQFIESTNYVAGTSGFRINANGAAEFADVTVRGAVTATSFSGTGVVGQTAIVLGAVGSSTSSSFAQATIYTAGGSTYSYVGLALGSNSNTAFSRPLGCIANGYAIIQVSGPGSGTANRRVRMSVQLVNTANSQNEDLAECEASIFFPTDYAQTLQVTLPFAVSNLKTTNGQGLWRLNFQFYLINEDNETQIGGLASIQLYQRMSTFEINR